MAVNVELPQDWFSPPDVARSRIGHLVEAVLAQRDDLAAMQWSYEEFRLACAADSHIADAVSFAGFEMAKKGQHANAIALLERHRQHYPEAPSAAFALARALEESGRDEAAFEAHERTLTLDGAHAGARRAPTRLRR